MRMDADSGVHLWMFLSKVDRPFKVSAVRIARADVEHRRDAGVARARDHLLTIGVVFRAVDVAMGIDEHD